MGGRYRALMAGSFADAAGVFVLDDTTFPKAGVHSVGVQRQYCGALEAGQLSGRREPALRRQAGQLSGRREPAVGREGGLGLRLFLPESWLEAPARLDKAGVPEGERRALSKGEIALELLDTVCAENVLPGQVVVGDSGDGVSGPLRAGLAERGLHYVLGVTGEMLVFTQEPRRVEPGPRADGRPGGRARRRHRLDKDGPQPQSLRAVAASTPLGKVTWRAGTKGAMAGRFAWVRVWPAHGWATGDCAHAEPCWLLIEEQFDSTIRLEQPAMRPPGLKRCGSGMNEEQQGLANERGTGPGPRGPLLARLECWPSAAWPWSSFAPGARPPKKKPPAGPDHAARSNVCSRLLPTRLPLLPLFGANGVGLGPVNTIAGHQR